MTESVLVLLLLVLEIGLVGLIGIVEVAEAVVERIAGSIGAGSEKRLPSPQQSHCVKSLSVCQQYCVRSLPHTHMYVEEQLVREQPV